MQRNDSEIRFSLESKLLALANDFRNPPIVIIGGGLAGLTAALGAVKKGFSVLVISKYSSVSRSQRVKVAKAKYLQNFTLEKKVVNKTNEEENIADVKFFKKFDDNQKTAAIGTVEYFLLRKVRAAADAGLLVFMDERHGELSGVNLKEKNITVDYYFDQLRKTISEQITHFRNDLRIESSSELTNINTKREKILPTVKLLGNANIKTICIPFRHLIDASGTQRVAFMKAAGNPKSREEIETKFSLQHPHPAQGTVIFHVDKTQSKKKNFSSHYSPTHKIKKLNRVHIIKFNTQQFLALKSLGWEASYPPSTYIITNKNQSKIYLGGDIPSSITSKENTLSLKERREKVIEWGKHIISHYFNLCADDLKLPDLEKKKISYKKKYDGEIVGKAAEKKVFLSVTYFDMNNLSRLKYPVNDLSTDKSNHVFIALGDALQSPHFHRAHGAEDAIRGAKTFIDYLPEANSEESFNLEKYQQFVNKLLIQHEKRLREINDKYEARIKHSANDEKQSQVSTLLFWEFDEFNDFIEDTSEESDAEESDNKDLQTLRTYQTGK